MKKKINLDDLMKNKKKSPKKKIDKDVKQAKTKEKNVEKIENKKREVKKEKIIEKKVKENLIKKNINNNQTESIIEEIQKNTDKKAKYEESFEFVNFLLGNEEYGIDSDYVKQIIKYKNPLDVGIKSDLIFGILSTKEGVLPLVDIRKLFNLNTKRIRSGSIIILQYNDFRVGIYVDYLIGIIRFDKSKIKKIPPFLPEHLLKYIKGVGIKESKKIVILIDNNILFSPEDIEEIKSLPEQYK